MSPAMAALLRTAKTVAVVGLSSDEFRPSHGVAAYLQQHGYRIVPVNPKETSILGETCYAGLASVPVPIDIVDIFRRSEAVPEIVDEAIRLGARGVWMQEGVRHAEAAAKANAAGLAVAEDLCILKEHRKL